MCWQSNSTQTVRPEDTVKLREFRAKLDALDWSEENRIASLEKVFQAVDTLAQAEVDYYFRRRGNSRSWSIALRLIGSVFGAAGVLLPLLGTTKQLAALELLPWGYVSLSIAASAFGANELFDVTASHARFVSTQLALERDMTGHRIEWANFLASLPSNTIRGFELIQHYAGSLYGETTSETAAWRKAIMAGLAKHSGEIAKAQSSKRKG